MTELNVYQICENDLVLAHSETHAIEVILASVDIGVPRDELEAFKCDLNDPVHDEEGNVTGTLAEYIKGMTEPQYLFGWE